MGFFIHWSWFAALSCALWMGTGVRCDCPLTNLEMQGGHYTLSNNLETGSMLVYHCPEGYYPYPAITRYCQANNSWRPRPKRSQKCKQIECPDPNVLEFGNVSPPQERYYVNNETTYECYSGYTMQGSARRTCLKSGKWSGSTPICSRGSGDHCANPGIPPGASRAGNIFDIDDTVTYTCNGNLFLVGSSERVCQENHQWTGTEPACYYKHTFDTPLEISKAFGHSIKESLTTLESTEDTQEARNIRISKSGILNIYIGVDISGSIDESLVNKSRDIVVKLLTTISSFSVTPNYEIIFFSTELYEIVNILDFLGGKVELTEVKTKLQEFAVGDRNTGTDLNQVFEKFWEKMSLIKAQTGKNFTEHRHAIIVFTDGAYNMGGSPAPTVARIKSMAYMNAQDGSRDEYLDIYIFAIGDDIFDDDLMPLTAGTGGKHYFRIKELRELQDTFDEMIDENEVKGLCGLHKEYNDPRKEHKRKMYPWMAFVSTQADGYSKKCMGSLVTPQFVLTAAHCVFGYLPEKVTVEINDGQHRIKRVKTFFYHEKYNVTAKKHKGINEFYDYDVALIQLEDYVDISTEVRPICIPCTRETNSALHLVDETCQSQERLLLKDFNEELSFLTRVPSSIVERKDVHAKLGDNRYDCIKQAVGVEGITADTLSEAVTDNFICTGGLQPKRDHIACTGDSGGAVFKNYEQRTIQVALVSWGSQFVCKDGGVKESTLKSRDFHINLFRVVPFLKEVLGKESDEFAPLQFLEN